MTHISLSFGKATRELIGCCCFLQLQINLCGYRVQVSKQTILLGIVNCFSTVFIFLVLCWQGDKLWSVQLVGVQSKQLWIHKSASLSLLSSWKLRVCVPCIANNASGWVGQEDHLPTAGQGRVLMSLVKTTNSWQIWAGEMAFGNNCREWNNQYETNIPSWKRTLANQISDKTDSRIHFYLLPFPESCFIFILERHNWANRLPKFWGIMHFGRRVVANW